MKHISPNPVVTILEGTLTFIKKARTLSLILLVLSIIGVVGGGAQMAQQSEGSHRRTLIQEHYTKTGEMPRNADLYFTPQEIDAMKEQRKITRESEGKLDFNKAFQRPEVFAVVAFLVLLIAAGTSIIMIFIEGVTDYSAVQVMNGKNVTVKEAVKGTWAHFGGYLWVRVIMFFAVVLWSLLFILPGIYKYTRYSLAGMAFFVDPKKYRGLAALDKSIALTKDNFITTFAVSNLGPVMTAFSPFGVLMSLGAQQVLYKQLNEQHAHKLAAPRAHKLSKLYLILCIIGFVIGVIAMMLFVGFALSQAAGEAINTSVNLR